MKIKPDDQWQWYYDDTHERIMLDLANGMVFRSHFAPRLLAPYARCHSPFSVDDAALFFIFEEQIKKLNIPAQQCAELTLNALIASRFLKPQMPKSWYFSLFCAMTKPEQGQLVEVVADNNRQRSNFIVAEAGDSASLCLLVDPVLELHDRNMCFCDPIKIMNDRLLPRTPVTRSLLMGRAV
ncbi:MULTISPECIES: cell division protein ZapC [Morganella]|uniref:Cell division protein ZapC n=1 Tax=Morganella morganii TaxID=582 RepID=A0A9Q4CKD7_MORMO|nr:MULTISPECIES: cell division protein ZapC [Morganella]BEP22030.1 cell division protein ZapC [Morganella morganii subsp. sibonii]HAE79102.1 cell division protein ZapC [Morganella sp. (in: enterobacteria)]EGT3621406.1 cell division protein ZapC [Morganella morganii]EGT3630812.1 cell division protein ZapC [Morganella morganii]EGT3634105.1 cell division protein ZapC [Morganella morganii]